MAMKTSKWTPIKKRIPPIVLSHIAKLTEKNWQAYLVGGCVRDLLLGRTPKDWDIVTDAPFSVLKLTFPQHILVGESFGVLKLPPHSDLSIDVAIFRKDGTYSNHRHPDQVEPGDLTADQARRDFTINGLYLNVETMEIRDGIQGLQDLQKKLLQTIGLADTRFQEDALRMLRLLRFSVQLGFTIQKKTFKAVQAHKDLLLDISRERIRDEVLKGLKSPQPIPFLKLLKDSQLWAHVFGIAQNLPSFAKKLKPSSKNKLSVEVLLSALAIANLAGDLKERIRLTNKEDKIVKTLQSFFSEDFKKNLPEKYLSLENENPGIFQNVSEVLQKLNLTPHISPTHKKSLQLRMKIVKTFAKKKRFPWLSAEQCMKQGVPAGPKLGQKLKELHWEQFFKSTSTGV